MRCDLLFGGFVGLTRAHAALHPLVCFGEVGLAGGVVTALQVSLAPPGEVEDRHGVVVGGIDLYGAFQILLRTRDQIRVGGGKLFADRFGLLDIALTIILQASGSEDVGGILVGLGPINVADGVVGFGIISDRAR